MILECEIPAEIVQKKIIQMTISTQLHPDITINIILAANKNAERCKNGRDAAPPYVATASMKPDSQLTTTRIH